MEAARQAGAAVPTLCHLEGFDFFTSCMVCVVADRDSGALLPACSTPVRDGMQVCTCSGEVLAARRDAVELLLGEHIGDCEGPCRQLCPAGMDIPLMIRQIAAGRLEDAAATVKRDIVIPAVLGRICPAPCEKGCRRGQHDAAVSICLLKRYVADADLASASPWRPTVGPASGQRVAVVGAGPAGLAAACRLGERGHICTLYDAREQAGGMLRYGVPAEHLPREVLDRELGCIRDAGVEFVGSTVIGRDVALADLRETCDAVVLATGAPGELRPDLGVPMHDGLIAVDAKTFATRHAGLFAGGGAVRPIKMAVRAVAHGKAVARSVDGFLRGGQASPEHREFNSRLGKLIEGDMPALLEEADPRSRVEPAGGRAAGLDAAEAVCEAERCLRCDCRARTDCVLRDYARELNARQRQYQGERTKPVRRLFGDGDIVYEPGKCIKCGRCVRITERAAESLGLAFTGRGYDVEVGVPFGEPLAGALAGSARECVAACPTGALCRL